MIEVEETARGLRVVDAAKNEVELEIEDWEPGGEALEIDRDVDEVVVGRGSKISATGLSVVVEGTTHSGLSQIPVENGSEEFSMGDHLVQLDGQVVVYIRFHDAFRVETYTDLETATISFPNPSAITLGFRSQEDFPDQTLYLPRTVRGVAAAISTFGEANKTDSPDRSYPSLRRYPPLLEFDSEMDLDGLPTRDSKASVLLRVPKSLESLFIVAPLAYYLDAEVIVDSHDSLSVETDNFSYEFSDQDTLSAEVASLLTRVFYMDCLVRNVGPNGIDIRESSKFKHLPFDPSQVFDLSIGERLLEYLHVQFENFRDSLPDWPLVVSIDPTMRNVTALPHLAYRMGINIPPRPKTLETGQFIERSIDGHFRSVVGGNPHESAINEPILDSDPGFGEVHGWIAKGKTVDAFDCPPEAFSNRSKYLDITTPISIAVVRNDGHLGPEHAEAIKSYRNLERNSSLTVDLYGELTRDELASLIETEYDLLHYIGHCDEGVFHCHDGNLRTSDLSSSNVQAFFLNACESYHVGLDLIRLGSVSGAVTISDVLDQQAITVGTTFAKLVTLGHSIGSALSISRSRVILNRQYTVVGDGTLELVPRQSTVPGIATVSRVSRDEYMFNSKPISPRLHGGIFSPFGQSKPLLVGNEYSQTLDEGELKPMIRKFHDPLIYNDKFYWPDELLEELF